MERGIDSTRSTLFVLDRALGSSVLSCFSSSCSGLFWLLIVLDHGLALLCKFWGRCVSRVVAGREALAGRLAADYPSAAESLREGLDELFIVRELGVPEDLERALSTTNATDMGKKRLLSR